MSQTISGTKTSQHSAIWMALASMVGGSSGSRCSAGSVSISIIPSISRLCACKSRRLSRQPSQSIAMKTGIETNGTADQVSASVNGGVLPRATIQTAVRYITGTIATPSSIPAAPNARCRSRRPAETSETWAKKTATQAVKTRPCTIRLGTSGGLGRG